MNSATFKILPLSITVSILLLVACNEKTALSSSTQPSTSAATSSADGEITAITTDAWLGKWNGPEGTFLEISGGNGTYVVVIQDLDGPKQYSGTYKDDQIIFERNGIYEKIQASNGAGTGMKWLSEKSNCLRINWSEGWCRD